MQVQEAEVQAAAYRQQAESSEAQLRQMSQLTDQLTQRVEEASAGTARLNDIIKGLEDRHLQVTHRL